MTRFGRSAMMLFLAVTMSRLLWTGSFGFFIQQRMQIPLILATIGLFGLGGYEAVRAFKEEKVDPESVRTSIAPRVGWLMVLPLLVLFSVAPTGLGAAAAERVEPFTPVEVTREFEALDTSVQPVEMRVFDFVDRAFWDPDRSTEDVTVRLEGLVVNDDEINDGFRLTRFLVSCCAADGVPIQVIVRGVDTIYEDDTWVVADVILRPPPAPFAELPVDQRLIQADVVAIEVNPNPPTDAYESPY